MAPAITSPLRVAPSALHDESEPSLQNGDRLNFAAFSRRWQSMPSLKRAELLRGRVYMQAAVSAEFHGGPDNRIQTWLGTYAAHVDGVHAFTNATARCDDLNAPQPDGALCLDSRFGGRTRLDERGFLIGAPELVAEIAASSASYDLFDKLEVYEEFGVEEYVVWLAHEREIRWFRRRDSKLQLQPAGADGISRSEVFAGLWLDAAAMVRGDMRRVLAALHEGLESPEHLSFSEGLRERASDAGAP